MEVVTKIMPAGDPPEVTAPSHTVQTEKRHASFPSLRLWGFQRPYPSVRHFLKLESVQVHSPFCYSLTAFGSLVCCSILLLLRAGERDDRAKGSTDNIKKPEKQGKQGNIVSSFSYSYLTPCWKVAFVLRYFAFCTETVGAILHLSLKRNGPVRF